MKTVRRHREHVTAPLARCELQRFRAAERIANGEDRLATLGRGVEIAIGVPDDPVRSRILAKILAERFVIDRGWEEERALALGRQVLKENTEQVFMAGN